MQHRESLTQLQSHLTSLQGLQQQCRGLVEDNNMGAADADQRVRKLAAALTELHATGSQHLTQLEETLLLHAFNAELEDLDDWLEGCEERASETDTGSTPDECNALQKACRALSQHVARGEARVEQLEAHATRLAKQGFSQATAVSDRARKIRERWTDVSDVVAERSRLLQNVWELLCFHRDADETVDWIAEKEAELAVRDLGQDLASVAILQRKHQALERGLEALGSKLESVFTEAGRLVALQPPQAQPITKKQNAMASRWEAMQDRARNRKEELRRAHAYHKFAAEAREQLSWFHRSEQEIVNVQPPNNVDEAEACLSQHLGMRAQLDAVHPSLEALQSIGNNMVQEKHPRSREISDILQQLRNGEQALLKLWDQHHELRREAIFVQEFHRDAVQCQSWLTSNEIFLRAIGASLIEPDGARPGLETDEPNKDDDSVDLALKKMEDFEQTMAARGEQISKLMEVAQAVEAELREGKVKGLYRTHMQSTATGRRPSTFDAAARRPSLLEQVSPGRASMSSAPIPSPSSHLRVGPAGGQHKPTTADSRSTLSETASLKSNFSAGPSNLSAAPVTHSGISSRWTATPTSSFHENSTPMPTGFSSRSSSASSLASLASSTTLPHASTTAQANSLVASTATAGRFPTLESAVSRVPTAGDRAPHIFSTPAQSSTGPVDELDTMGFPPDTDLPGPPPLPPPDDFDD